MSLIRSKRGLVVFGLLAAVALMAPAPVSSQTVDSEAFGINSVDDGDADTKWEIITRITPRGGCQPKDFVHAPFWLPEGQTDAARVSDDCRYSIAIEARKADDRDTICAAEWAWGAAGAGIGTLTFETGLVTINALSDIQDRLFVRNKGAGTPECAVTQVTRFRINGSDVVTALPANSADSGLSARAVRGAAVTGFSVLVEPDYNSASDIPQGCTKARTITVLGDGENAELKMASATPSGTACSYRAKVTGAPAPFQVVSKSSVTFVAGGTADLTSKVKLPIVRIAIIQNVTGSGNKGTVSYAIDRSCATGASLPPVVGGYTGAVYKLPGGLTVSELREGRFTVHYPPAPYFGAAYTYQSVATSETSSATGGCSVTATINNVPDNCNVPALTQTITWSSSNMVQHFDFEFRISCFPPLLGTDTSTGTTNVPATTTTVPSTTTSVPMATTTEPTAQTSGPGYEVPTG